MTLSDYLQGTRPSSSLNVLVSGMEGMSSRVDQFKADMTKEFHGHRWLEIISVVVIVLGIVGFALTHVIYYEGRFNELFSQIADLKSNVIRQDGKTASNIKVQEDQGKSLEQQAVELRQQLGKVDAREDESKTKLNNLAAELERLEKDSNDRQIKKPKP